MSADLVSLTEASNILGVSPERVRQLVVAADLPGRRFGNAWAVPIDAVVARRNSSRPGGRPLGSERAWSEIMANEVDLERPGRYQRRAEVVRCEMSRADLDSLTSVAGALLSGVRGAIGYGAPLVAGGEDDVYLSRDAFDRLEAHAAVVSDPLGPIRLRVVDANVWESLSAGALAPRGAVALDLLESADPRHRIAAEKLLADGGRTDGSSSTARRASARVVAGMDRAGPDPR